MAEREHDKESAPPRRSIIIHAVPIILRAIFIMYVVFRPPTPGIFCASVAGCYDVDFGSGFGDGTIAYYHPDGERSRQFPLRRVSSGVYTVAFDDERVEVLVEDKDYLICNDETTYVRTSLDQVPRHIDALRRAHEEAVARKMAEKAARVWQERVREELTRATLRRMLEEDTHTCRLPRQRSPRAEEACHCPLGDPLCSCL
jgi:hypothetical protein